MRHEINQAEATAIRRAQAEQAERIREQQAQAEREREQREMDEWQARMEIRYRTQ